MKKKKTRNIVTKKQETKRYLQEIQAKEETHTKGGKMDKETNKNIIENQDTTAEITEKEKEKENIIEQNKEGDYQTGYHILKNTPTIENKAKIPSYLKLEHKDPTKPPIFPPFSTLNKEKIKQKNTIIQTQTQSESLNTITQKKGNSTYTIGNVQITNNQIEILDKGLGFVPNIEKIDIEETKKEIEAKVNKVIDKTLKEYKDIKREKQGSHKLSKEIAEETEKQLEKLERKEETPNLTKKEIEALNQLRRNKDIVIKPIDKNLGTAVINTNLYIEEVKKLLNNPTSYKKLKENPIQATIKRLNSLIENLHKEKKLNKKIAKKIKPNKEATPGRFYALPKIHKPKLGWRPIVANNLHPTENLSKWINTVLKPTAEKTTTYIENSYQVTKEINLIDETTRKKEGWVIITADVDNLYTNIPHREGTESCIEMIYDDQENKLKLKDPNAMKALIHNTLANNVFEFNNEYFTQIQGTAMGTSMAPAYANLYLANKERKWLEKTNLKSKLLTFKRYLDDILIIYDNSDGSLPKILGELKELYKPLNLTIEHGKKLPFLDLTIELNGENLQYNMYRKPLNAKEVIPYNSYHPTACKEGTIIGEYKRIQRLNSTALNKRKEEIKLMQRCLKQKYPIKDLKRLKKKSKRTKKKEETNSKVYMTLTYNKNTEEISKTVRERLEQARRKQIEKEGKEIPKVTLITSYKTQSNLKKILTKARVNVATTTHEPQPVSC